jgi:hypothetical protein
MMGIVLRGYSQIAEKMGEMGDLCKTYYEV